MTFPPAAEGLEPEEEPKREKPQNLQRKKKNLRMI